MGMPAEVDGGEGRMVRNSDPTSKQTERCVAVRPLSEQARSLWAKTDRNGGRGWLPLVVHLWDAGDVGAYLWDQWLPAHVRELLAASIGADEGFTRRLVIFLCAAHDVGKATPVFQSKGRPFDGDEERDVLWVVRRSGLPVRDDLRKCSKPTHAVAGEVIVSQFLEQLGLSRRSARSFGAVVGAHHGMPARMNDLNDAMFASDIEMGRDLKSGDAWASVQMELMRLAQDCSGLCSDDMRHMQGVVLSAPFACLVTGVVIMADWLASNTAFFPLINPVGSEGGLFTEGAPNIEALDHRSRRGWEAAALIPSWTERLEDTVDVNGFSRRFMLPAGASIRPVQRAAVMEAHRLSDPGLMIIEAPMGEGKTEAALAAAEVFAARHGCGGVCIALPTMATTDAMFGRVHSWLERLPRSGGQHDSFFLAHGKAQFNEEYQGLVRTNGFSSDFGEVGRDTSDGTDERAVVSSWMRGRKKGMLANFVVCTVDQVLMGALTMRHVFLRQLSLLNKVVIIDECHAYDSYMQEYLCRTLEWLGAYKTPVILLSATLPVALRERFVNAYREGAQAHRDKPEGTPRKAFEFRRKRPSELRANALLQRDVESNEACRAASYPALTLASASGCRSVVVERSSRAHKIDVLLMPDDLDALIGMLDDMLADGGCAGVICDTVSRAQCVARALEKRYESGEVALLHARFMDIDRMGHEESLRVALGQEATISNGLRPRRIIVVGTQVLEQSLDIDFDLLITDLAPIDLVLQRIGRVHRHQRGADQTDRPKRLRHARCFIRGVDMSEGRPAFPDGIDTVYEPAALIETLSVFGFERIGNSCAINIPDDIALFVQQAYGDDVLSVIPRRWQEQYRAACERRARDVERQKSRARAYLMGSATAAVGRGTPLDSFFDSDADKDMRYRHDEEAGQRAVRDARETVEVMLLEMKSGALSLLPWIGDEKHGISFGANVPIDTAPSDTLARVVSQCSVRLPSCMSAPYRIDALIDELENLCEPFVRYWQDSGWLAGRFLLPLAYEDGEWFIELDAWRVSYTAEHGLSAVQR